MERVRLKRRAPVPVRRPPGDGRPARVEGDYGAEDEQRPAGRVDVGRGRAGQTQDRPPGDEERRSHEKRALGECREVVGLPVAVGVPSIGRPGRHADREEGQERRDEVGPGVDGLGDQAEAAGREADDELEDDEEPRPVSPTAGP